MNGQYIIPGTEISGESPARSFESSLKTTAPEYASSDYSHYKKIENKIKVMREAATEETLARSVKAKVLELFTATPRPLKDRLIEEESVIGGRLFASGGSVLWQRFWCHENDWFFEQSYATPQGGGQVVLHYKIHENNIDKFYGGRKYIPDEAEIGRLLAAIEMYQENVQHQLYSK